MTIIPGSIPQRDFHQYLLAAVGPRPIAFASTVDKDGNPNLAPFSFYNCFGSNPPILIFSPALSGRTGQPKQTLLNIRETMEVVIHSVSYNMIEQVSLASCEYPVGVSEFVKAGFTPIASEVVKPFRVKEAPVQFECKVLQIIETGAQGGAGNLIICEVLRMHISDDILDNDNRIDADKIDLAARMGGDLYCRASGGAVFTVAKPNMKLGVGFDQLPASAKNSTVLTGNDLGRLANLSVEELPVAADVEAIKQEDFIKVLFQQYHKDETQLKNRLHHEVKLLLDQNRVRDAWAILEIVN